MRFFTRLDLGDILHGFKLLEEQSEQGPSEQSRDQNPFSFASEVLMDRSVVQ